LKLKKVHAMETSMDSLEAEDLEMHVGEDTSTGESCDTFLDFATIHAILRDK
jgi:hypothetical protein